MISDENLAQIRALLVELLRPIEDRLAALTKKVPSRRAERMRRYRAAAKGHDSKTKGHDSHRQKGNDLKPNGHEILADAVELIPLAAGGEFGVSAAYLAELERAYPAVDGPATLKEIRAWCVSNPTQCKTRRGVPRFLNSWFARIQNHG